MKYTKFGTTGLEISKISFGTSNFGSKIDNEQCKSLLNTAYDNDINFIDTSNQYGGGLAEKYIGSWIEEKKTREEMIIATKFVWPTGKNINQKDWSRKHIKHALNDSLKRLGTDFVDLYLPHGLRPDVNLKEILEGLHHAQEAEKILYPAIFASSQWQLVEAFWLAEKYGWDSFYALEHRYSLVARGIIELDFKDVLKQYNIPFFAFTVQGSGFLTGKYVDEKSFTDHPHDQFKKNNYGTKEGWELLGTLKEIANNHGVNPGEIAINWALSQSFVSSVIVGGSRPQHITQACEALDLNLSQDDLHLLEEKSKSFLKR